MLSGSLWSLWGDLSRSAPGMCHTVTRLIATVAWPARDRFLPPSSLLTFPLRFRKSHAILTCLSSSAHTQYRSDIDGLRGIAVLLVVLYHLDPRWCPSGFVGVDLFFVISGFVVTRSTLAMADMSPLRMMAGFWRRRVLRIMPALFCMIVCVMFATAAFMPPFPFDTYRIALRTGAVAIFGLSNWYLNRGALDYFRDDNNTNPFLHTWSLAVEEQFYVAFAFLFLGVLWRFDKLRRIAMLAAVGVSVSLFCFSDTVDRSALYYLIQFRFWEIACGSAIAYFELPLTSFVRGRHSLFVGGLASLNLALLGWAAWLSTGAYFPRVQISIGVLSGILFVVTGFGDRNWVAAMLRMPGLVAIGRSSYSLYLWHFPVFFFGRHNFGLDRPAAIAAACAVLTALTWSSYTFIEQPYRKSQAKFSRLLPVLGCGALLACGAALLIPQYPGAFYLGKPQDWSRDWLFPDEQPYLANGAITSRACNLRNGSSVPAQIPASCRSTSDSGNRNLPLVLVVGDSHAYSNWSMVFSGKEANHFEVAALSHDACSVAVDKLNPSKSCETYWGRMPDWIRQTLRPGDTLFLAIRWPFQAIEDPSRFEQPLKRVIEAVERAGANVVLQAPLPVFARPAYLCSQEWFRPDFTGCSVRRDDVERAARPAKSILVKLASENKAVRIWDPLPLVCQSDTCNAFSREMPLFRDTNHLSVAGAKSLSRDFLTFWLRKN